MTEAATETRTFLRPLGDRVVVKERHESRELPSGLILPDSAIKKTLTGVIVALGPGPRSPLTGEHATMNLEIGDEILYGQHAGIEVTLEGVDLLVLHENEVVAVIDRVREEAPAEATAD